jgi:ribosomal protein L37AE/L43A
MLACPRCGQRKRITALGDGTYLCASCGAWFDDDPDEGGEYSNRNPAARLERQEAIKDRRRERFSRRS